MNCDEKLMSSGLPHKGQKDDDVKIEAFLCKLVFESALADQGSVGLYINITLKGGGLMYKIKGTLLKMKTAMHKSAE